jgi:hypothetical protein
MLKASSHYDEWEDGNIMMSRRSVASVLIEVSFKRLLIT